MLAASPLISTVTAPSADHRQDWRDPARLWPLAVVAATVAFNLIFLRQELSVVSTLNDSSVHELMVRFATNQWRHGHFPLDGWFPYLGLGSPIFLHYQSLGAVTTGLLGVAIGSNQAFSLVLYLLVALWPICIYASARLLGLSRWQAAVAALLSPLVRSITGVGYEQQAYLWVGFGVWSQLVGMWMLPLAWGFTARVVRTGRGYAAAVVFITLTVAAHFQTGYLTIPPLVVVPLLRPSELWLRLRRGLVVGIGAALCSAWLLVPLQQFSGYASINEFLQGTPDADSYGAHQALIWLADGSLLDSGNLLPVLTVLGAVGLVVALYRWRRDETTRLIICLFAISLVLFFGRPTLGPLVDLLPGSHDLFLRRFLAGVQLTGIYLAAIGLVAIAGALSRLIAKGPAAPQLTSGAGRSAVLVGGLAVLVTVLAPSWTATLSTDRRDAAYIRTQMVGDATQGKQVNALVARALRLGPGRFFAGMPNDVWGTNFTVGDVPVFKYLANLDVDIVGYTLRTASLMTDPEGYFDEYEAADYRIFGVRYLLLPTGRQPSVAAVLVSEIGQYALWQLPSIRELRLVATEGVIAANRATVGDATEAFLHSNAGLAGPYPVIAYGSAPPAATTVTEGAAPANLGTVLSTRSNLADGEASAVVEARQPAVVVLSASFDPGWRATVDGRPVPTEMVAPALVAVAVPKGRDTVSFRYAPPGYFPELFGIAGVTLALLIVLPRRLRRRNEARDRVESAIAGSP